MLRIAPVIAALFIAGGAADARALALGQLDDFQDGTTQGWTSAGGATGATNPNPPIAVPDGGPLGAGDAFLEVVSNGMTGLPGSRLVAVNRDQWSGDYLVVGVTHVFMDVANPGDTDLFLRVALVRLVGGVPSAVATASSAFLPAGADWQRVQFGLTAGDLVDLSGLGVDFVLDEVFELRILSSELPEFQADTLVATLWVDNVSIAPEPAALALLVVAGGALWCRRARRTA